MVFHFGAFLFSFVWNRLMNIHEKYMNIALKLAKKGGGYVNPNPMVGTVIVKDGEIIGKGYHKRYGSLHAEINAILSCKKSPKGATMYVTLEPCCHHGKTPPCTEAIIENKIDTVIIATKDPNPLVSGMGIKTLRDNNIKVIDGILEDECKLLNRVFFHYIKTNTPFVVMKWAMTLDGKIATRYGFSKWITGSLARENVHKSRHIYDSIMVGINTVIKDNPLLTSRLKNNINPKRIICDSNLRIPLKSNIVKTSKDVPTYIATFSRDKKKIKTLKDLGCNIIKTPKLKKHIDLKKLMIILGEMNIDSVLLEGGSSLNYSALGCGIVNRVEAYIAPKIFGGKDAKTPVGGEGVRDVDKAFLLENGKVSLIGEDILIEYDVRG